MERHIQLTNGKKLRVFERGEGEHVVILVHGLTGNHKQMAYYQDSLASDHRVISYDLRGRGLSDETDRPTSIDHHVGDLLDLLMMLNLKEVTLVGYSIGGYICAKVTALSSRVRSLILLDGAGVADFGQKELILPSLQRLEKPYQSKADYIDFTKRAYEKLNINWSQQLEEIAQYETKAIDEKTVRHRSKVEVIEKDFDSFFEFNHEEVLPHITVPVLLVKATGYMGAGRPLFFNESFAELEKIVPRINVLMTNANHFSLVFERQKDVLNTINRFLTNVREDPSEV
ncbi:pimeloyl-ACP methyl ester carboxylesterase [Alkalibacillus filiformis]|uniref:Pimeloyl-ACP methyl ester carboxylesterase n=1 Tax=Alkalibacillus filiformis TaxID=200990 RepID=A0ABU0DVJ9_9BACI|nr:alpha/beta hydrolase [Alkalibacillus filiformis]MDQ0352301.1 pimeloyl-ACP methyl ester carboxylesterase [Alkalibacillus filiformis]